MSAAGRRLGAGALRIVARLAMLTALGALTVARLATGARAAIEGGAP